MFIKNSLTYKGNIDKYTTTHLKTAIIDSGFMSHFITNMSPCEITEQKNPPLKARMPNDETIMSCNTVKLNLPMLNKQARKAHVFRELNNNLLSVGQLCDAGYNVKFDKQKATVHNKNEILFTAKCDHSNGLWRLPLTDCTANIINTTNAPQCNHAKIHKSNTKRYLQRYTAVNKSITAFCNNVQDYTSIQDAISYLQAAAFSPVKTTLVQAIKTATSNHCQT
jgi:hypothetical protein